MTTLKLEPYQISAHVSPEHVVYLNADALRAWLLDCALANNHEPVLQDTLQEVANVIADAAHKAKEARHLQ